MKNKQNEKPFACSMSMEGKLAIMDVSGVIGWDTDTIEFCDAVDAAKNAGCDTLMLRINSCGGYCYDGMAMADKLLSCGMATKAVVHGSAMSMASYLMMLCDERVANKSATIMFHQPSACICGTVDEIAAESAYLVQMRDNMFAAMAAKLGKSGEEFSAEHNTTKYYTAQQALELGMIDSIDGEVVQIESLDEPATASKSVMDYGRVKLGLAMLEEDKEEEDKPAPEEDKEKEETPAPATSQGLTMAQVEEVIAKREAAMMAGLGAPAHALPAVGGGSAPAAPVNFTNEQLDKMPDMRRLALLDANPALYEQYLKG